jgi:hypothetical protein
MSHSHDHSSGHANFQPSFRAFFTNFSTYDAPFTTKVRLALRNTWIKIRTHSDCCGNDGEPGC